MKKTTFIPIVIILAVCLTVHTARERIGRYFFSKTMAAIIGAKFEIKSINHNLFRHNVEVTGLKIMNPKGFKKGIMAEIPQLYIDYNIPGMIISRSMHLNALFLNLDELRVIRSKKGHLNIMSIKCMQNPSKKRSKRFVVNKLYLTIGKVIYKDYYLSGPPLTKVFDLNLKNRLFERIRNITALGSSIIYEVLTKTTISKITRFNLNLLRENLKGVDDKGTGVLKAIAERRFKSIEARGVRGILKGAMDTLKQKLQKQKEEQFKEIYERVEQDYERK